MEKIEIAAFTMLLALTMLGAIAIGSALLALIMGVL